MTTVSANPERQLVVPPSQGTPLVALTSIQPADWVHAPLRTASGKSLGSLEHYNTEWNAADAGEVSSRPPVDRIAENPAGPTSPTGRITEHPVGPSLVGQKLHAAKVAILAADQAAAVSSAE